MNVMKSLLLASALGIALGAQAQGTGNPPGAASTPPAGSSSGPGATSAPLTENSFAMQAARTGLAEVELGKLAQKRASNPDVKQYADELVKAHSENNKQLQQAARDQGIKLPKALSRQDQQTRDQLARLSGPEFDQRFMQVQVQKHQDAIDLFQREADSGQGPLRSYAEKTLPHLQSHLETANELSAQVGATSGGEAGSSAAGGASQ